MAAPPNAVERLKDAVLKLDPSLVGSEAKEALRLGVDPLDAIEKGLVPGIREVGRRFEAGEFFLIELVMGAEAFKAGVAVLEPQLSGNSKRKKPSGKVVLGSVAGDIHSIGKDILSTLLTANGFEVHDLGVDVPVEKFVEATRTLNPDIIGMSALMTTTAPKQYEVIRSLQTNGLRDKVKIMIGGAATSEAWRAEIGADLWEPTANGAVRKALQIMRAE